MKRLRVAVLALALSQGCGGVVLYPDTDIVEPKGFNEPKVATGILKAGGMMQQGTLEYAGSGELVQVYREYVSSMRDQRWAVTAEDIGAQKASGSLKKDNRTCSLEFISGNGQIRVTIKVTQAK